MTHKVLRRKFDVYGIKFRSNMIKVTVWSQCVCQGFFFRYYLKNADTFPNDDDVTSTNFFLFIGIGSP